MYAICPLAQIPLRKAPNHAAEMISQVLFGETLSIESHENEWFGVTLTADNYKGWVHKKQVKPISNAFFEQLQNSPQYIVAESDGMALVNDEKTIKLPQGSCLPLIVDKKFVIDNDNYKLYGEVWEIPSSLNLDGFLLFALSFENTPYLWGGRNSTGVDCSGFVQAVYKWCGLQLPRDAYKQAEMGKKIDFVSEARLGDLAFFENEEGHIIHVGIVMRKSEIIHASGKVRSDMLDDHGIFDEQTNEYTHKLKFIKRLQP